MKKLLESEDGISPVVGMIIVLALTITSISLILLYATPTLDNMEDMANAQGVEQAFTVFDSRTSKVALGESPSQTTSFSIRDGNIEVNGKNDSYNDSKIVVICVNSSSGWYSGFEGSIYNWRSWEPYLGQPGMTEFNASMGSITYTKDDRIIGYEGGGIWSKYPSGSAVMISPPELHYNGETVTLPIMAIAGGQISSGTANVDVTVSSGNMPSVLYPDPSVDSNRINPVASDKVLIYIKSEFYNAWADYAETLTSTNTALDHENKTAIIELDTIADMGTFPLAHSFRITGMDHVGPAPIHNFSFYFYVEGDSSFFKSSGMIMTATSGTKELVYSLSKKNPGGNIILARAPGVAESNYAIEYTDSSAGIIEIWESNSSSYFSVYSEKKPKKFAEGTVDFLSDTYLMDYDSSSQATSWGSVGATSTTPDLYIVKGNANSTQSLNNISQHYLRLLAQEGTIEYNWDQKKNDKIEMDKSSYSLEYDSGGAILTYLHVSRNDLSATLT